MLVLLVCILNSYMIEIFLKIMVKNIVFYIKYSKYFVFQSNSVKQ